MPAPRSRSLVIGGVAAACALVGAGLAFALTGGSDSPSSATVAANSGAEAPTSLDPGTTVPELTSTTSAPAVASTSPSPEAAGPAASTVTTRPPPAPVVAPPPAVAAPEGLADPAVVARRFAEEYWTWRWNDPDGSQLARARPYITDKLAAEWAQSSSAAAYVAARRASHEVQTPTFAEIYQDPEQLGFWHVQGTTTTTADGAPPKTRQVNANLIILDRGGWRVDSVEDLR